MLYGDILRVVQSAISVKVKRGNAVFILKRGLTFLSDSSIHSSRVLQKGQKGGEIIIQSSTGVTV